MEKVTVGNDLIALALTNTQKPGSECEPRELLKLVSCIQNPLAAFFDMGQSGLFFDAVAKDFGFVSANRTTGIVPTPIELEYLDGLMRWLVSGLSSWRAVDDPLLRRLICIFVTTRYCEMNGTFWQNLPACAGANVELIRELSSHIAGFKFDIAAHELSRRPVSDGEAIEAFRKADAEGNWPGVEARWRLVEHLMPATVLLSQAVQYLNQYDAAELIKATSDMQSVLLTAQVLSSLTMAEALTLALNSNNAYLEFAVTLKALPPRPIAEAIDSAVQQLLTQLLIKVSANPSRWAQWLEAFNRYPSRYPTLHVPLGRALAALPIERLAPYVSSIILNSGEASRESVGDCLRAFRSTATAQLRCALWTLAHTRWIAWNFGAKEAQSQMLRVTFSVLDYALVGYAVECISPIERDNIHARICAELSALPTAWHSSHAEFLAASFRLISRLQPFLYAKSVGAGDWLRLGSYALPFDPKIHTYVATLFGITEK